MNFLKKILYSSESLEFNLRQQIYNTKHINLTKIYVFFVKLFRLTYKSYQRIFLMPKTRNLFRLMLQTTYTPIVSLSNWNKEQHKSLNYFQNKLTNLKIKLQKDI